MRAMIFILSGMVVFGGSLLGDENLPAEAVKIGELNEAYVTAFNSQQPERIAQLFTAEGEFTILTGDMLSGRQQVAGGHRSFFENNPDAKISGQQLTRRFIRPHVVIATGKWNVKNGPSEYPPAGLWSTVLVKHEGQWKYEAIRLIIPVKPSS